MKQATRNAIAFFHEHAGWSYDPAKETSAQGRRRGAQRLAKAERIASDRGYSFEWQVDHIDSSEFSDEQPPWQLWCCVMRSVDGTVLQSLGGVDFGRDGDPWGDPYRRVVEAELALEETA